MPKWRSAVYLFGLFLTCPVAWATPFTFSTAGAVCSPAPTIADIKGTFYWESALLTTMEAAHLQIPFVSAGGSRNEMVLVRHYVRGTECLATDKKTHLFYGQAVRTIITIADYDASLSLSLTAIAADGTLKRKSHRINIDNIGFENPEMQKVIAEIAGKDFNVENYATYMSVESRLVALVADPQTQHSVHYLGRVPSVDDAEFTDAPVIAFALQQISEGRSCLEAKGNVRKPNEIVSTRTADTYTALTDSCDTTKPDEVQRATARKYLSGLKVRY